ncbi:MAG: hypothetical protein MR308_11200 [Lachnospiraceae bacterium]|nr:hypothetical protein [Lachnospiraceae bacterium]
MGSFNFYINVDQCLNMSNFDMFFYKLQSEHKFHLSNVQFFEDRGENSLQKAFYDIRGYIDKAPFLIQDYRLIFGMRKERLIEPIWWDSVLYRLLKIYYGLRDARIFIKSKDTVDKNVSVIMLYDTDFTFDSRSLSLDDYDLASEIELLMECLDIPWNQGLDEREIAELLHERLANVESPIADDMVTKRFLNGYLSWFEQLAPEEESKDFFVGELETEDYLQGLDELGKNLHKLTAMHRKKKPNVHNSLYYLISFAQDCVGHYCVFQKEINKNSMDQNMLALLSIVDYITSDLKPLESGETIKTNETLKEQSRRNWEQANNDDGIQKRYGKMIADYKSDLQIAFADMQRRVTEFTLGAAAPEYREPEKLSSNEGLRPQDEKVYRGEFEAILREFLKNSIRKDIAEESWKKAYSGLKEKLSKMEYDLNIYAQDLSKKYKEKLELRKEESIRREDAEIYSQDSIIEQLERQEQKRSELLEKLRKPQMNPSLTFQDQLNLEHSLEQCNSEVGFFVKCHKMIKLINFFLLILVGGGLFALHYLVMQTYVLSNVEMLCCFFAYLGATFLFFLLCWNTPFYYFKKKIRKAMEGLKEQMDIYIRGYFDKADNFREYINTINELDAVNAYILRLNQIREKAMVNSREYLWHKVQIQEHIRKCGYFEGLVYSLDAMEVQGERDGGCPLDVKKDIIHNPLYWPQRRREVKHD